MKDKHLPMEYLELLDTSDPEKFKASGEEFHAIVPRRTSMSHQYGGEGSDNDAIADAFKPKGRR